MAVGKSNRIVIEVDPNLKMQVYEALRSRGLTLKEWFTQRVKEDLVVRGGSSDEVNGESAVSEKAGQE